MRAVLKDVKHDRRKAVYTAAGQTHFQCQKRYIRQQIQGLVAIKNIALKIICVVFAGAIAMPQVTQINAGLLFTVTRQARDPLHNPLQSVISRTRAVCCVVFLANSRAIGCKRTPCSPSRSDCHSLARVMQRVPRTARRALALAVSVTGALPSKRARCGRKAWQRRPPGRTAEG